MEINEMNLAEVVERIAALDEEVRSATEVEAVERAAEEKKALLERKAELEKLEARKAEALAIQKEEVTEVKTVEEREVVKMPTEREVRANNLVNDGKFETRAILSTGRIAKPTSASNELSALGELGQSIVDDVHAIPLTGTGAWIVGYKKTDAIAAAVTDGSAITGTPMTVDYVTINPAEWGVFDQVSNQVKKMSPVDYLAAVEESALIALREEAANKIVTNVMASSLAGSDNVQIDADYLRSIALAFRSVPGKGGVMLYINQADLILLGKVRGTNEKKALYDIAFNPGTTMSGTISQNGLAVPFRVIDKVPAGTQLFGQPLTIDMPMWDNYEIKTDEGGKFFEANMIGVRGLQTAGADLVAYKGMIVITN